MKLLRILLFVGIGIEVLGLILLIILKSLSETDANDLCFQPVFLILRLGGELIIFLFFIFGIAITRKVRQFEKITEYEKTKQKKA